MYYFVPTSWTSRKYAVPQPGDRDVSITKHVVYEESQGRKNSYGESEYSKVQADFTCLASFDDPNVVWETYKAVKDYGFYREYFQRSFGGRVMSNFSDLQANFAANVICSKLQVKRESSGLCIYYYYQSTACGDVAHYGPRVFTASYNPPRMVYHPEWNLDDVYAWAIDDIMHNMPASSFIGRDATVVMHALSYRPAAVPSFLANLDNLADMISLWESNIVDTCQRREAYGNSLIGVAENAQATDVVNIENIVQVFEAIRDFPNSLAHAEEFLKLVRSNPLKAAANAKLSYDYSFKTTMNDLYELAKAVTRPHKDVSISRSRQSASYTGTVGAYSVTETEEWSWKAYYRSSNYSNLPLYRQLQEIGADPSFEHVWNVIPYSFVVDWFLPVTKIWQQIDYETTRAVLPIETITHGHWRRFVIQSQTLQCRISAYNRDLVSDLPSFPYFLPTISPDINWWNGGALIVQRVR